jgi:hypothetical protein
MRYTSEPHGCIAHGPDARSGSIGVDFGVSAVCRDGEERGSAARLESRGHGTHREVRFALLNCRP